MQAHGMISPVARLRMLLGSVPTSSGSMRIWTGTRTFELHRNGLGPFPYAIREDGNDIGFINNLGRVEPPELRAVLLDFLANLDAAAARGRESGNCGFCGRLLQSSRSKEQGIGPDCKRILGIR